jgi:hypothetical protein
MHVSGYSRIVLATQRCFHTVYNNLFTRTTRGNYTTGRPTMKRLGRRYMGNIVENRDDG